ncbi:MAG: MFS transporter [Planctomycetaceae bacterium]|nr:MFS transporter [Planctomycetaceae bacterium]
MDRAVFRLILLTSLAHALVHVLELALPGVEQLIGEEYGVGREWTGLLGTAWRMPFGMGALLAGWLADRYGSRRLLVIYLLGSAVTCAMAAWSTSLAMVFVSMFSMGCFASIYHPAGLSLISRETTAANRGQALGWHGIIGSIGIASAPFLAGVFFSTGQVTWRQYYLVLAVPAVGLAVLLHRTLRETDRHTDGSQQAPAGQPASAGGASPDKLTNPVSEKRWPAFLVLVSVGALSGMIYGAFMHFLPRYLDGSGLQLRGAAPAGFRNLLAAVVLGCGIFGQAISGRLARPGSLEKQLAIVLLANVPCLLWMAAADGSARLWATCLLALVHFMNQPLYNSLIAQLVPRHRRSVGYGFSNMVSFGLGAFGPAWAGFAGSNEVVYGGLAVQALVSSGLCLVLARMTGRLTADLD